MKTNLLEVIMGAVVLVVCGFFVILAYSSSRWHTTEGYDVFAKFDRIDGIVRGSDVRLSGVKVGTIKDIQLDPNTYLAVVHIGLAPNVSLPTDSAAEIVSDGLLGGKYMALVPGGDDSLIPVGGEIMHTQSAVSLESLIGKFMFSADEKKSSDQDKQ
jgi:phospholipid/cholesterol/gamma-HCH transport system substrate-binding protein